MRTVPTFVVTPTTLSCKMNSRNHYIIPYYCKLCVSMPCIRISPPRIPHRIQFDATIIILNASVTIHLHCVHRAVDPPVVSVLPDSYVVKEGGEINMECRYDSNPSSLKKVTW